MRFKECQKCDKAIVGQGLQRLCAKCILDWRWCNKCSAVKEIGQFKTPNGTLLRYCYRCKLDFEKAKRKTPEGKLSEYISHLVSKHKIPRTQAMVLADQKACSICANVPHERLHIDHDHLTGQVRGALCRRCNYAVSVLEDDPNWQISLSRYLGFYAKRAKKCQFT